MRTYYSSNHDNIGIFLNHHYNFGMFLYFCITITINPHFLFSISSVYVNIHTEKLQESYKIARSINFPVTVVIRNQVSVLSTHDGV